MTVPPILVTGGTGTLGRQVVEQLRQAGRDVRVLSRRSPDATHNTEASNTTGDSNTTEATNTTGAVHYVTGDLATGAGLAAAVRGAGTIVHCASNRKGDADATRNLVQAATPGRPHLVYISIVGVDRFPRGYYKAKLATEHVVAGSGLPWTTLRATQFYELIYRGAAALAKLPAVPVPAGFVTQPVDSGEVAARLADLALAEPNGRVPDMAGPQLLSFADVIRSYLRATGRRPHPVLPVWIPGLGPIRAGAMYPLPGAEVTLGHHTWPEFLARMT